MHAFYAITGLNQRRVSILLGMTAVTLRKYERGTPIPLHVRYAMAAVVAGLPPFSDAPPVT